MKAIYACKLYKSSPRKDKIKCAMQNPVNAETPYQDSIDWTYCTVRNENLDDCGVEYPVYAEVVLCQLIIRHQILHGFFQCLRNFFTFCHLASPFCSLLVAFLNRSRWVHTSNHYYNFSNLLRWILRVV